jgi:EmrB/QacA subfamily drug resistance transporter
MAEATMTRTPLGATLTLQQRLIVMGALLTAMFLFALDQSIVATAVPHMLADLGGFDIFGWVFTIYLLSSTVTIPIVGKLSDMFGRRNYLLVGIGIFVASSLACGIAPSMTVLIAARCMQGIGGGMIVSCVFATLGDLFTPLERAKYFAMMTGMFTFSLMAGPTFGGFLTDGPGWRWCFYINLPLGLIAAGLIAWKLPSGGGSGGRAGEVDFLGSGLLTIATITAMLAIVWSSDTFGWGSPITLGLLTLAAVTTVAFVLQEHRHAHAVIPLSLFKNVPFVQSVGMTVIAASTIFGAIPYLPTFVQTSLGGSATASGLVVVPRALALLCTSVVAGQLVSRTGKYKYLMVIGAVAIFGSVILLRGLHSGQPIWHLAAIMGLMGFGEGMVFPMSQVVVQAAVSQDQQGVAASTRQFFLQVAQSFGVGIFGLLLTTWYASSFTHTTADIASAIPPAAYEQLKDPTLALDPVRYSNVATQVQAQPNGDAMLRRARDAQRESVATAIDGIFTISVVAALFVLIIAATLRRISLTRDFHAAEVGLPDAG